MPDEIAVLTLYLGFARVAAAIHYPSDILGSTVLALVPTMLGVQRIALLLPTLTIPCSMIG